MRKLLLGILSVMVVDAFFFDFKLRVFPIANSKMILAVIGAVAFVFDSIRRGQPLISKRVIKSAFLAVLFSLWCFVAITINGTDDRTFVKYFASFGTWLGGAYGVYAILKLLHGRVDLGRISWYLALVCVSQCVIALLIDNVGFVRTTVNSIFLQASDFYESAGRLYGIACALDPAGVRFSAVQVLIAHQMANEESIRKNVGAYSTLFISFLVITVVGSIISRTTGVGTALGLGYILMTNLRIEKGGLVSRTQFVLSLLLLFLILSAVGISTYLYNTSSSFHNELRFGFEGFFNWVETGEFRTGSTDHLQTMWVWPETPRSWILGEGKLGVFQIGSDIGYCNYIFHCGLIGLSVFTTFFLFNHLSLISKFKRFTLTAWLLVAVTLIVWCKVMTDIFLVDALLFCIDGDKELLPEKSA